jgi:hypothetical protein
MKKTYQGSCHCKAVRFSCQLDLAPAGQRSTPELPGIWWTSTFKCNCSSCWKNRFWKGFVRAQDFRLEAGESALADYQFAGKQIHHRFCRSCGAQVFGHASFEQMGGAFYAVNISCLDDVPDEELADAPVTYEDGRHDAWDRAPAVTDHL